ncbi:MAG: DUF262 domain-containing protein [Nitrospirae bacterium]|nr:DUF262 domain-containing protein [Nitrospirota bacterium]
MAHRVNLDAMIVREDFGIQDDQEFDLDLFTNFPISNLSLDSPILKLLRKPDFQRETHQWTPVQIATFIASFLDNEVIPSLILWNSPSFIFVIDGGHRLSALRAWMEDDYGDGQISNAFYERHISDNQKQIAGKTRKIIEKQIGRFSTLKGLVDSKGATAQERRAKRLFTRGLQVQWVQGTASVAESSFYKINSQGTPLDEIEELLIRNRKKPIAIGARAILRSGTGNKYWSEFDDSHQMKIKELSRTLYELLFEPEMDIPVKTLELPFGGIVSPLDALSVLVELLTITSAQYKTENGKTKSKNISDYDDDDSGKDTIDVLNRCINVLNRVTGNYAGSLGLHPAVYFYNERGKHSRIMFLAIVTLVTNKLKNNDDLFFRKFSTARKKLEEFLIVHKSLISTSLQNMSNGQRVQNMINLFEFLIMKFSSEQNVTIEEAMSSMGLQGRILDLASDSKPVKFSDDVKSMAFIEEALVKTLTCAVCGGILDPKKSSLTITKFVLEKEEPAQKKTYN